MVLQETKLGFTCNLIGIVRTLKLVFPKTNMVWWETKFGFNCNLIRIVKLVIKKTNGVQAELSFELYVRNISDQVLK